MLSAFSQTRTRKTTKMNQIVEIEKIANLIRGRALDVFVIRYKITVNEPLEYKVNIEIYVCIYVCMYQMNEFIFL